MSGLSAMAVCIGDALVEGCDATLSDACLTFAEAFVRLAGGVISGAKPAAIFGLPLRAYRAGSWRQLGRSELNEVLRTYAKVLPSYGVSLAVLYRTNQRVFVLVWRPQQLAEVLRDGECLRILREAGYVGSTERELTQELRYRLRTYYRKAPGSGREFPHEIGIFLGYPASDVRGFLDGLEPTCIGAWHAYGDTRLARRRFRALEESERRCRTRYAAGEPLSALFA